MEFERLARKIGPTNFILIFLFPILCIYEFFDGRIDVGDYGVALLFALFINDMYLGKLGKRITSTKRGKFLVKTYNKYRPLKLDRFPVINRYPLSALKELTKRDKIQKNIMNVVFTVLLVGPIFLNATPVDLHLKSSFYKTLIVIWSLLFLGLSYFKLKEENHKFRYVYLNLALVILVGTAIFF